MSILTTDWTQASDLGAKVQAWYGWHRARLARTAEIEGLYINEDRFLLWVLDPRNVARRTPSADKHQRQPMRGRHVDRGSPGNMRGSDLAERVWVCVRVLELKRFTNKVACITVTEALGWKWSAGKSRRGRPRRTEDACDYIANVQTVRSIANKYRLPGGFRPADQLVHDYVGQFLLFEDWLESIRGLLENPMAKQVYEKALGAGYLEKFLAGEG